MSQELSVLYCPFCEVTLRSVTSELLERIGSLPLVILSAVSRGHTAAQIAESICIPIYVVTEAVKELVTNQLLLKQEENYLLSDCGKQYLRIYRFIMEFESRITERLALNLFTCQLEKVHDTRCFTVTSSPDPAMTLPDKLKGRMALIKTPDLENSREYLRGYFDMSGFSLTEDDYAYLSFQLEEKEKDVTFYVPYGIPPESYTETAQDNAYGFSFDVSVPLCHMKRCYQTQRELQPDGKQLHELLTKLSDLAPDYLNESGLHQAELFHQTDTCNEKAETARMDAYSGTPAAYGDNVQPKRPIKLPSRFSFETEYAPMPEAPEILVRNVRQKEERRIVRADFRKLIQKEGDCP